jgi:hypothetical protein
MIESFYETKKVPFPSFWSRTWSGINSGGQPRKSLKALDPPVRPGDDDIITLITFREDLFMIPIYNEKFYY